MTVNIGQKVRLTGTFRNQGSTADPTAVTLLILAPDGTTSSYTYAAAQIVKDATGIYHMDYTVPSSDASVGSWYWRMAGTGTITAVEEGSFDVRESEFF